jgi:glucokinase
MRPVGDPASQEPLLVGVDVGGTKILAGAVRGTEVVETVECQTDVSDADAVLGAIETAVREISAREDRAGAVGLGLPSQIDYFAGRVVGSVNIPLAGVELRDTLAYRLGLPVFLDNDANCAALAEAELADGGAVAHLVMLTLGTGVGGGVVVDGRVFRGASGLGAELGHLVIETEGPECPGRCPNRGCLEALCSGQALARDAGALAAARPGSRLAELARERGGALTGTEAVTAAREGDLDALGLFERFGTSLGVGMAGLMNVFEPERLVVGGGLSAVADLYLSRAEKEARRRVLPEIGARVGVSVARSGALAGVIGAARLAVTEGGGPPFG